VRIIRAVIDTNVLHAGLYSATGASFRLLRLIDAGRLIPVLSTTLLFEYEDVLKRNRELLDLSNKAIEDVLDGFCSRGEPRNIYFLWRPQLPDQKDDHVLELAVAAGNVPIVTHNVRDFHAARMFGVRVMKPAEMLKESL
jgi:putative PIN family toxin of toxin-antitoxin system